MRARLSAVQRTALITIISSYDRAVRDELARWGGLGEQGAAARGVETPRSTTARSTRSQIRGFVHVTTATGSGEELRRGAFGRWIGGTKKHQLRDPVRRADGSGRTAVV